MLSSGVRAVVPLEEAPCSRERHCLNGSGAGPFVYRLGRQVFNLERGVRFPYGLPSSCSDQTFAFKCRSDIARMNFALFPSPGGQHHDRNSRCLQFSKPVGLSTRSDWQCCVQPRVGRGYRWRPRLDEHSKTASRSLAVIRAPSHPSRPRCSHRTTASPCFAKWRRTSAWPDAEGFRPPPATRI